jgi:hypothetical protein
MSFPVEIRDLHVELTERYNAAYSACGRNSLFQGALPSAWAKSDFACRKASTCSRICGSASAHFDGQSHHVELRP